MSKNKKKMIIVTIIILLPLFIFIADFGVQSCVVMNYLCQKYDAEITDFKLVKYTPKHTKHLTPKSAGWFETRHYGANWQYQYNDRIFNVQKIKGTNIYFDDYQLEDISKWATEYLQENVDPNIIHVNIDSENIYRLLKNNKQFQKIAITQDDVLEYLNNFKYCKITYYLGNDLSDEGKFELENLLFQNNQTSFKIIIYDYKHDNVPPKRIHSEQIFRDDNDNEYCYKKDYIY